jgi:hypothetical protein
VYGYGPIIETDRDLWQWRRDVIAKVIDAAEAIEQPPQPADEIHRDRWDLENAGRVACPLCGSRGSGAFGRNGWIVPGGLEMPYWRQIRLEDSSSGRSVCRHQ